VVQLRVPDVGLFQTDKATLLLFRVISTFSTSAQSQLGGGGEVATTSASMFHLRGLPLRPGPGCSDD
jgi:hypothetical protein